MDPIIAIVKVICKAVRSVVAKLGSLVVASEFHLG